jgi:WD40 repeat protein
MAIQALSAGSVHALQGKPGNGERLLAKDTYIMNFAVSPDGASIASVDKNAFTLWSVETGKVIEQFSGVKGGTSSDKEFYWVSFSPDGKSVATHGFQSASFTLWEIESGKARTSIQPKSGRVNGLSFHPDGKLIAVAGPQSVELWDLEGTFVRSIEADGAERVAFSSNGRLLAWGSGEITLYDMKAQTITATLASFYKNIRSPTFTMAFSPDGNSISGGCGSASTGSKTTPIEVWDVGSKKLRLSIVTEEASVRSLTWSPDGKRVAAASAHLVTMRDSQSGKALKSFERTQTHTVAFTPDGKYLVGNIWTAEALGLKMWPAN